MAFYVQNLNTVSTQERCRTEAGRVHEMRRIGHEHLLIDSCKSFARCSATSLASASHSVYSAPHLVRVFAFLVFLTKSPLSSRFLPHS
eukprot:6207291-Pleurochrysis_carterae.AAC.1